MIMLLPQPSVCAPCMGQLLPKFGDPAHHPLRKPQKRIRATPTVVPNGNIHPRCSILKLATIHLHDLPVLQQICEVKMVAPNLNTIKIRGCWALRRLPVVGTRSGDMKKPTVEIEKDVWDALELDGEVDPDHFGAPLHSRYYKKKLPRVSVLR
ncbi:hypothetical protein ZWY2020_016900 [Hordeum vulgare]|nr:hypothetical protein ZWY2020_016900 [Hordeum vulgare]